MSISKKVKAAVVASVMLTGASSYAQSQAKGLPVGYREVEYIVAPRGSYIDTGYQPNQKTHVTMTVVVQGAMEYWFGCWDQDYNSGAYALGNDGTFGMYFAVNDDGGSFHRDRGGVPDGQHKVEITPWEFRVDDVKWCEKVAKYKFGPLKSKLYLFAQNRNGSAFTHREQGNIICKGCTIVEEDAVEKRLIRDFVPCIRLSDATVGLYERVNGEFYMNAGAGRFTAKGRPVLMLVNKSFEYNGFRMGIAQAYAQGEFEANICSDELGAEAKKPMNGPIARYKLPMLDVEVYCTEYLFKEGESSSHSERKYEILTNLIGKVKPEYVISVSTSESTTNAQKQITRDASGTANGCVYVGNRFFVADCSKFDPHGSQLKLSTNYYHCAMLHLKLYDELNEKREWVRNGMRPVRYNSAHQDDLKCIAAETNLCIGVVNVTNYLKYVVADPYAYTACLTNKAISAGAFIEGIETTHGVVAKAVCDTIGKDVPVMFISPITDRYEHFDADVDGTSGMQNREVSFNGGVVTAHILELWDDLLKKGDKANSRKGR